MHISQNYNDDPLKDAKKQHGDFLRQQIKQNEEKKYGDKIGRIGAQMSSDVNIMHSFNNNNNNNSMNMGGFGGGLRDSYDYNGNNQRGDSSQNKSYGDYLRQQVIDYFDTSQMNQKQMDEKKRRQSENAFDSKSSKIQALQDKMSSQQEIPFGRGGAGAPLVGKNGQVISSRKPDPSNIDYDSGIDRGFGGNGIGRQPNPGYQQQQQSNSLQKMSINDQFSALLDRKNDAGGLGIGLLNRNNNSTFDYGVGNGLLQQPRAADPFKDPSLMRIQYDSKTDNTGSFRRKPRGILAQENELEGEAMKKEQQKSSMQQALVQQMEEKQRKKLEEKKREKEEEMRIEERVRMERIQIEKELQDEQESKKKKVLQVAQQNEHTITEKKKPLQSHHLPPHSPSSVHKNNNNNHYSTAGQKSNILSATDRKLPVAQTLPLRNFPAPNQTVSAFDLLVPQKTSTVPGLYQIPPIGAAPPTNDFYPKRTSYLDQRPVMSSEARRKDIIPEIEGMKMQIQEQYKRIQVDMQRVKIENFQAIDDRNKGIQRSTTNYFTDHSSANKIMHHSINGNNMLPMQQTQPQQQFQHDTYKQFSSTAAASNSHIASPNTQHKTPMKHDYMNDYFNEGELVSLQTDSKMIPMDLIDQLRNNDQLTMSQLMNYDHHREDATQQQLSQHKQQQQQQPHQRLPTNSLAAPLVTQIPTKDLLLTPAPSNTVSKEIENILNKHTNMFNEQQDLFHYNQQSYRAINSANPNHQQQRDREREDTTFNKAAKGLLGDRQQSQQQQQQQQQQSHSQLPSLNDIFTSSQGMAQFSRAQNNNNQSNDNANNVNHNHEFTQDSGETNFMRYNSGRQNGLQDQQLDYSYYQSDKDNLNNLSNYMNNNNNNNNNNDDYDKQGTGVAVAGSGSADSRDKLFEYITDKRKIKAQKHAEFEVDEDSDEIKKQKALREIKDRFQLSTVNEEWNEHTKRLSTILETGKYADNKELYESLKAVDDPDFIKLDELIRQFKSEQHSSALAKSRQA